MSKMDNCDIVAKCVSNIEPFSENVLDELEVGKYYVMEDISIGQSFSHVKLTGINHYFNSVLFEFYKNGEKYNIFADKRFNKYKIL